MTQRPQMLGDAILLDVARQLVEQIGDRDEVHVGTMRHGLDAERHGEMRLADTRWAEEDHVLAVGQEAQGGQLLDLFAINRGLKVKVEIGQGLDERKVRQSGLGQHAPLRARRRFGLEQAVQEIEVGELVLAGLLRDRIDQLGHPLQFQAVEMGLHPLVGEAHASAS